MNIRPISLQAGWYPRTARDIEASIEGFSRSGETEAQASSIAAITPHAGWSFCGRFMASSFRALSRDADCLVLFGGHLPAGARPLAAMEDAFQTPLGPLSSDRGLRDAILPTLEAKPDLYRDNTVEVLLPMAKRFFPSASVFWLRVPNDPLALEIGELVAKAAAALGRKAVALGSTDLTHYGPGYGFAPRGGGKEARRWVREENDAAIVGAFLALQGEEAIRLGDEENSACSAGAAAAAMAFAAQRGAKAGRLLGYGSSADVMEADDFVGYCSVAYP